MPISTGGTAGQLVVGYCYLTWPAVLPRAPLCFEIIIIKKKDDEKFIWELYAIRNHATCHPKNVLFKHMIIKYNELKSSSENRNVLFRNPLSCKEYSV